MGEGQSGGVSNTGIIGSVGGSIVGGDQINFAPAQIAAALAPLAEVIAAQPPEIRADAEARLAKLKAEAAKGKDADDGLIARTLQGLVKLVPTAATAVGTVFAGPVLGGLVGPATKFLLDTLRGE